MAGEKERVCWYAIPSANVDRANSCLDAWKNMGYRTCVLLDEGAPRPEADLTDLVLEVKAYVGYYKSFNHMVGQIGRGADVIITGGDDIYPDPKKMAQEIVEECFERFPDGFFIMQPIGDKMDGVDRICASPWFGRGWLDRAYGGRYPVWPGYSNFFGDQELKEVSTKLKVLWQREDLVQYHDHWARPGGPEKTAYQKKNDASWKRDENLYKSRMLAKFPGMWPLAQNDLDYKKAIEGEGIVGKDRMKLKG